MNNQMQFRSSSKLQEHEKSKHFQIKALEQNYFNALNPRLRVLKSPQLTASPKIRRYTTLEIHKKLYLIQLN